MDVCGVLNNCVCMCMKFEREYVCMYACMSVHMVCTDSLLLSYTHLYSIGLDNALSQLFDSPEYRTNTQQQPTLIDKIDDEKCKVDRRVCVVIPSVTRDTYKQHYLFVTIESLLHKASSKQGKYIYIYSIIYIQTHTHTMYSITH